MPGRPVWRAGWRFSGSLRLCRDRKKWVIYSKSCVAPADLPPKLSLQMKEANGRPHPWAHHSLAVSSSPVDELSRRTASDPREFLHNRIVNKEKTPRAHGLSVGANMNPDKQC